MSHNVFWALGHHDGIQAPGLKLAWMDVLRATHHTLIAHGRSVQMLREHCRLEPIIGWAPSAKCAAPPPMIRKISKPPGQEPPPPTRKSLEQHALQRSRLPRPLPEDALRLGKRFSEIHRRRNGDHPSKNRFLWNECLSRCHSDFAERTAARFRRNRIPAIPSTPITGLSNPLLYIGALASSMNVTAFPIFITENGFWPRLGRRRRRRPRSAAN